MVSILNLVIGTAGHIDHGKSSLVKDLTGIDPDRLKEEKERGLTTEIGYASLKVGEDQVVGFIDVPGHEKFIKKIDKKRRENKDKKPVREHIASLFIWPMKQMADR